MKFDIQHFGIILASSYLAILWRFEMYGIKVWSSEKDNDWYLLKDMNDGVIHVWDKKEEVEQAQKNLNCRRSAITKIMSSVIIDRALNKRKEEENLKYFLK